MWRQIPAKWRQVRSPRKRVVVVGVVVVVIGVDCSFVVMSRCRLIWLLLFRMRETRRGGVNQTHLKR